ncbi:hypothetical protein PR202_gb19032 [Eleusine coracana subsp. coracana]|uniref:Uncharacterized protein n=1 Tax=Eleusine coracana subsp. coracana TaxID=191504 RepID=A0AAV5F764_ELECO|nr:hypothetical protein PR202_gb19032 [Eleusine coracana subsp. coracana]
MTEDQAAKVVDEPTAAARQRKKRKWDQPAEDLLSAAARAAAVAGLPLMNVAALPGIVLPRSATMPPQV